MINAIYEAYQAELPIYNKIWDYYRNKSDVTKAYQQTERSNLTVSCNYVKKFVKEEASYSVGNKITFSSKSDNKRATELIDTLSENFNENHDILTFTYMTLFGVAYELTYIDKFGDLQVKAIRPNEGYCIEAEDGTAEYFARFYGKQEIVNNKVEIVEYADLYTAQDIQTYKKNGQSFIAIGEPKPHYFGEVPVAIAKLTDLKHEDTIYSDIKTLQDALETNFSDIVNEISDFRNAYLVITGLSLEEEEARAMKDNGIIENPTADGKVEWLIKNINDTFIQNTLKALQEKIYEISSHINTNDNETMANASGVALKSRLINLMQRCKANENSYSELLKTRIRIMFTYAGLNGLGAYDWKDITSKYSPLIPSDDSGVADIIQKLDGKVSLKTLLAQLSFVENPNEEYDRLQDELLENGTMDNYSIDTTKEEEINQSIVK